MPFTETELKDIAESAIAFYGFKRRKRMNWTVFALGFSILAIAFMLLALWLHND